MSGYANVTAPSPENPTPLGEGLNGVLGFLLTGWEKDYARIEVQVAAQHRNRQGGVHGGVLATLLDATTGFAGIFEPDPAKRRGNATVSLTTSFLGRAKGDRLVCEVRVTGAGRRLYFARGEVRDGEGTVVATAEAVYAYTDIDAQRR
ncbi:MAG: PaaI family thioesterase [Alphaproteobacteria bacterium]|nr:PaaI family thioesterase [Alphaproteobacteria bacterium]